MRFILSLCLFSFWIGLAHAQIVKSIKVVGNQRIESATILANTHLKVGRDMTQSTLDDALRELYGTGYFADVKINENGGIVTIHVVEQPMVNHISFEGNSEIDDKILTEVISLKERKVYSLSKLKADTKVIQDLYRLKGYFSAKVTPQVIRRDQNRVDVVFAITEGKATKVSKIIFVGNKAYKHSVLEQAIQTKESRWFRFFTSDDSYDPDRIELDKEKLRRFYMEKGYVDFRVKSAVAELTPDQKEFFITFSLDEGKRYKVGDVSIHSNVKGVKPEELKKSLLLKTGDWYSIKAIDDTIEKFTEILGNKGYAFVDIQPDVNKSSKGEVLDVSFSIQEGPSVYIDKIIIKGNHKTDDDVVRRELLVYEGDAYNAYKIRMSERRIRYLGFFKKVDIKNQPTNVPDKVNLVVDLEEEASTGELWIAGGVSTSEGLLAEVGAQEHNFMGRGQDIGIKASLSKKRRGLNFGFTEPYFLDRRLSAGINLNHEFVHKSYNGTFERHSTGGRLSFGYDLTEFVHHSFYYGASYNRMSGIGAEQSKYLRMDEGKSVKSFVGHTLTYDTRDNRFDPKEGHFIGFGNEVAGLGGSVKYHKHDAFGGKFFELHPEVVLSLIGHAGIIRGLSNQRVRIDDRYTFGGEGSIRGFRISGAEVRDAGKSKDSLGVMQYYLGTAELAFPLGLPNELAIKGVVFSDVGAGWGADKIEKNVMNSSQPRASIGAGLIWHSPFGPLRIDYAHAIKKHKYDRTQQIHFGFAARF